MMKDQTYPDPNGGNGDVFFVQPEPDATVTTDMAALKQKLWARIREHQAAGGQVRNLTMSRVRGSEPGLYGFYDKGNPRCVCITGLWLDSTVDVRDAWSVVAQKLDLLEAGFEWCGLDNGRAYAHEVTAAELRANPYYRLGEEIARVLDEEERAVLADKEHT